MLRARMRATSGWSDACILNISSHGMMINAPVACAAKGSIIELWHGGRVIVGTVVWRKGTRAGLRAEDRIAVDEILAISQAPSLQLTAESWPQVERRKRPRDHDDSRLRSRAMESAGVAMIAASLAVGAFMTVEQAFAAPIHYVRATLGH
jgi:hypothetical protein